MGIERKGSFLRSKGFVETRARLWAAFSDFTPNLHPEKSVCNRSHFQSSERPRSDFNSPLPNGLENRLNILLCINEGIGSSHLREEVGIGVPQQWKAKESGDLDGSLVEIDPGGIEMAIFERIKKVEVFQKIAV